MLDYKYINVLAVCTLCSKHKKANRKNKQNI